MLAQMDLDEALLRLDKMPSSLTKEEKERKDCKALSQIHLYLSKQIIQDILKKKTVDSLWLMLEELCMTKSLTSKALFDKLLKMFKPLKMEIFNGFNFSI